jgi:hypothetical protein
MPVVQGVERREKSDSCERWVPYTEKNASY